MRSAGLRPQCPPTISAGASRINKRKFTAQNPSCGFGGDVVTARLAGIAAQAEQGVRGGGRGYQNGGPPFANRSPRLSLFSDHLRTVLAVKGSLRRAQQRRALDGSGPFLTTLLRRGKGSLRKALLGGDHFAAILVPFFAATDNSADSLVGISATDLREHRTPRYRIALGSCHPGTPASCSVAVVICTGARASSNPTVPLGVDARSLRIAWAADAELKAETGQSLSSARKEALKFAELYLESMTYSHLLHRRAFSFLVVSRSRSQFNSCIFNVSPTEHASCRPAPTGRRLCDRWSSGGPAEETAERMA